MVEDEQGEGPPPTSTPEGADAAHKPDIGARVLRQTGAFAVLRTLSSLLTWGGLIVLSRILDPRAFGAFEIGIFWIGLGQMIGDGGLAASLIRTQGELTRRHYQVAFTFAFAVALLMGLCFFWLAPLIGAGSNLHPDEVFALRAMAPLYVLPVLRLVPYVKLEREINFALIGRIELLANLVRHTTAIVVALIVGSVWALIASQAAWIFTQVGLAYLARPGWVGLGWNTAVFRSLFAYGSKVQLGNVFLYMKNNVGRGLLGFWLGPAAVGIFGFGLGFVNVPSDAVNGLARVQFPAYARLKQGDPELYRLVRGAARGALLVGLAILGVLVAAADWAIPTIYSDKWLPAVPVVWSLIPHVAADLLALHLITFVQGQGRAGLALLIYGLWSGSLWLLVVLVLVLLGDNLAWVGLAYGVGSVGTVALLVGWASRYLSRALARDIAPPLLSAMLGFGLAFGLRQGLDLSPLPRALLCVFAFLATYAGVLLAVERRTIVDDLVKTVRALRR